MYWTDGSYYKGNWERGIQHGEGEMCMPGEVPKRGMFECNVFIGEVGTTIKHHSPMFTPGTPNNNFNSGNIKNSFQNKSQHLNGGIGVSSTRSRNNF